MCNTIKDIWNNLSNFKRAYIPTFKKKFLHYNNSNDIDKKNWCQKILSKLNPIVVPWDWLLIKSLADAAASSSIVDTLYMIYTTILAKPGHLEFDRWPRSFSLMMSWAGSFSKIEEADNISPRFGSIFSSIVSDCVGLLFLCHYV